MSKTVTPSTKSPVGTTVRNKDSDNQCVACETTRPGTIVDATTTNANTRTTTITTDLKDLNQVVNKNKDRKVSIKREDNSISLLEDDDDDDEVIVVEKGCQFIEREVEDHDDNDNAEIQILGSTGMNANSDWFHNRGDCITYPFTKDPKLFCGKCFCYACDVIASKCMKWKVHCKERRGDKKWTQHRGQVIRKRKAPERALQKLNCSLSSSLPTDRTTRRARSDVNYSER
mmetsp:Transcript_50011/g.50852  ORF Transcript_50011/g.50852 Transcript_50011/m.50852 type:complete len:230 (+) Transcript_50011:73-762(+)